MGAGIREEQQQIRAAPGAVSGPKGASAVARPARRFNVGPWVDAHLPALPDMIGQGRRALAQSGQQIAGQGRGKFRGAGRLASFLCEDFGLRMHVA